MRSAARVFAAIGTFAAVAAALLLIGSGFENYQGASILATFAVADFFLWLFLRRDGRIELSGLAAEPPAHVGSDAHMPPPSWMPVAYSLGAVALLLGLVISYLLVWLGLVVLVATSVGWAIESVREYRHAVTHESPAPDADPAAIAVALRVQKFADAHGGADAVVRHTGRGNAEVALIGGDGALGTLASPDVTTGTIACALARVTAHDGWPAGLGSRVAGNEHRWMTMAGEHFFSAPPHAAPRDGALQTAAKVFLSLGIFAIVAAALYAAGKRDRDALQATSILVAFGVSDLYLYLALRGARAGEHDHRYADARGVTREPATPDPPIDLATLHLPGPSWWPAGFAVAAVVLLVGLVFSYPLALTGVGLIVTCSVGWGVESVREYRATILGGGVHR